MLLSRFRVSTLQTWSGPRIVCPFAIRRWRDKRSSTRSSQSSSFSGGSSEGSSEHCGAETGGSSKRRDRKQRSTAKSNFLDDFLGDGGDDNLNAGPYSARKVEVREDTSTPSELPTWTRRRTAHGETVSRKPGTRELSPNSVSAVSMEEFVALGRKISVKSREPASQMKTKAPPMSPEEVAMAEFAALESKLAGAEAAASFAPGRQRSSSGRLKPQVNPSCVEEASYRSSQHFRLGHIRSTAETLLHLRLGLDGHVEIFGIHLLVPEISSTGLVSSLPTSICMRNEGLVYGSKSRTRTTVISRREVIACHPRFFRNQPQSLYL